MKPEVHQIVIRDNDISMHYYKQSMPSWYQYGFKTNILDAVTPENNEYDFLRFGKKRDTIEFTPTEIAVWYSHAKAWALCRDQNKPIIVVEHDIKLLQDIPESVYDSKISCLAFTYHGERQAKLAGGAYYLTPEIARRMLLDAKKMDKVIYNSDSLIHHWCSKRGEWNHTLSMQITDDEIGVTVEHNK